MARLPVASASVDTRWMDSVTSRAAEADSPTLREIFESRTASEEGSFNAPVGRNGQPFRFTFSRGNSARIGNQDTHLPRKIAQHLRLSDVVAA